MNKKSIKILLLVEDNPGDARLLREMFGEQGSHNTELTHVECMSEAEKHLTEDAYDIIVLDLGLPDAQGLEAVRRAHAAAPRVPLVVLTGLDDESLASQALREGAQDYLIKGQIDTRGLQRALRYAIERKSMEEALFVEKERAQGVRAVERQSIEESLRRALERNEFAPHYQPKVNLKTGEITGAEALIRWTHPTRGPVPPGQFIPVAEDCGLILPIGNWVLREACKQARAWLDAGLPLATMAVNVSAMEFRHEHFLEAGFSILNDTRLEPRCLELELAESVLIKHAGSTESILRI